jgi:hypothetical protein
MIVDIVLIAIGAAFNLAVLAAVIWALTRSADRIQMASVCLFACAAVYFFVATRIYESNAVFGALVGVYAFLIYAVVAALAIFQKSWAWKASLAAFGIHGLATVIGAFAPMGMGKPAWVAVFVSLCICVVGMYALLHKGSRLLVSEQNASTA